MVQPQPRRRRAKNVVLPGKAPPNNPPVLFHGNLVARPNAETLRRNADAHQHPQQVVVGPQQQANRVLERRVVRKPGGVRVAVRADDGKAFDRREELHGDPAHAGIGGEKPLCIKMKGSAHSRSVKWSDNIAIRHGSGQDSNSWPPCPTPASSISKSPAPSWRPSSAEITNLASACLRNGILPSHSR